MAQFQVITQKGDTIALDDNNEIHRGGEGRILLIDGDSNHVAKIYHPGVQTISEIRFNQLQKLNPQLFLKPVNLLFQQNQIIGFTMEYAGKEFFPLSSLFSKIFCQRNGIDGKYKLKIANQLIEAVKSAHFNGFIIGDLNQFNVLLNLQGDIRLIDIDSYETPGHKHTGVLLDDIRDYYYQGSVSMNSDYFALSILLFNLITYTHPFKGIHDKYKSLAERMIHKIPIFAKDPLLKIPKCYEPIQNKDIQGEFVKQYVNGERFLLSLTNLSVQANNLKTAITTKMDENDISIQLILQNTEIKNVYFKLNLGYIKTNKKFILFSSANHGYLTKRFEIEQPEFEEIYLGNENIIARKQNKLFVIKNSTEFIEIKNFTLPHDAICHQMENILIAVAQGQMYWIYLDEVLNTSVKIKRTEVFSQAITHHNGLIQNTGGIQRIFYNTGKDIASVKTNKVLKKIFQIGNTGIAQYIDNKQIINNYFKITALNIEYLNARPESFLEYAYIQGHTKDGFILEQGDNIIKMRRTNDFEIISEIKCSYISSQTTLFYSNSGIIAWEDDAVYLINQKK